MPDDVVTVFILPPSIEELRARLERRAEDCEEVIARRLANAKAEIAHELTRAREQLRDHRERYNPETTARMDPGFALSAVDYLRAVSARGPMLEGFCAETFADADVLALPTSPATLV
jgi:Asp-tRNA(Asn)/Glu-tRNA(Gln) amidotransferase A subunit family amidase